MNLTTKIAMAAGALTLTAGGIAAAVTTPEAAEPGLTTAEEQVGTDLPVGRPGTDEDQGSEATDDDGSEDTEAGAADGTHGAVVSEVAKSDFETGREHGEAVSEAARDNHGAAASAEHAPEDEDADEDETEDETGDADEAASRP